MAAAAAVDDQTILPNTSSYYRQVVGGRPQGSQALLELSRLLLTDPPRRFPAGSGYLSCPSHKDPTHFRNGKTQPTPAQGVRPFHEHPKVLTPLRSECHQGGPRHQAGKAQILRPVLAHGQRQSRLPATTARPRPRSIRLLPSA